MKIANLMFGRGLGGIEQAFLDYNDALRLAGHEVLAITNPLAQINSQVTGDLTYRTLHNFGSWDLFAALKLRKMLQDFQPDATIAHGNRALCLARSAGIHKGLHVGVTHNYNLKHFKKLDIVFAITKDLRHAAIRAGVNDTHIMRIPNMIHLPPKPAPKTQKAADEAVVIGTMGRMVAKKGFDHLIEAAAKLKALTRLNFKVIIGGEGQELSKLKRLIKKHQLQEHVELRGWVEDKAAFYAECDVFCLPSLHEPFGIVLLEAMSHGVPIVAYESEGPHQIFQEYPDAGLLVPVGDVGALANELSRLLPNTAQQAFLAKRSREVVEEAFAIPVVSQKIDAALKRFIH